MNHDEILAQVAADVERLARQAFEELVRRVLAGESSIAVIMEIQSRFSGDFVDALAIAFGAELQRVVGPAMVRALPIGEITLSRHLYRESRRVASTVHWTIERHARGMQQARELALQVYDGFGRADQLSVRARLPKYLREALADAAFARDFTEVVRRGRAQADRLRTQPLRAAYLQAVDTAIAVGGGARLRRVLRVAAYERNRYFANRIAQTELHRVHTDVIAADYMAEEKLEWVQIVLSQTHPRRDVCDLVASVDRHGLGPGVYPKALAPKPPFHPHCRCLVRPRIDLTGRRGYDHAGAERAWLRKQPDAARIMGSKARAAEVVDGARWDEVYYRAAPQAYKLKRLGDQPSSVALMANSL